MATTSCRILSSLQVQAVEIPKAFCSLMSTQSKVLQSPRPSKDPCPCARIDISGKCVQPLVHTSCWSRTSIMMRRSIGNGLHLSLVQAHSHIKCLIVKGFWHTGHVVISLLSWHCKLPCIQARSAAFCNLVASSRAFLLEVQSNPVCFISQLTALLIGVPPSRIVPAPMGCNQCRTADRPLLRCHPPMVQFLNLAPPHPICSR